jgi:hypothetical protein
LSAFVLIFIVLFFRLQRRFANVCLFFLERIQ